jgi:tryptophan synthase beta chain
MDDRTKYVLDEDRIPRAWYNIVADLPTPPPPVLHPGTGQPIGPGDLAPLFPMELIKQVVSTDRGSASRSRVTPPGSTDRAACRAAVEISIPRRQIYYQVRGRNLDHKPNTASPGLLCQEGVTRLATETGAGVGALRLRRLRLRPEVMATWSAPVRPEAYRRVLMETYGASVVPSPSLDTEYGRSVLAATPDHTGSLGLAISEAIEDTVTHPGTKYSLGSVFDFVLLHQTVIGLESIEQMAMAGEEPDVIVGCTGGGSNFAGLTFPWLGRMFRDGADYRVIAAEPEAASLTRGVAPTTSGMQRR